MQTQITTQRQRGFTLVELALVLGIVGLIIAGIWAAATAVSQNEREQRATKDFLQIVQNVRNLYFNFPSADGMDNTNLEQAGVFPANMKTGTLGSIANSWNGPVIVQGSGATFTVFYDNVPQAGCIEMLTNTALAPAEIGLLGITVAGTGSGNPTPPVSPADAASVCAGNDNEMTWTFSIR